MPMRNALLAALMLCVGLSCAEPPSEPSLAVDVLRGPLAAPGEPAELSVVSPAAQGGVRLAARVGKPFEPLVLRLGDCCGGDVALRWVALSVPTSGVTVLSTTAGGVTGSDGRVTFTMSAGSLAGRFAVTATTEGVELPLRVEGVVLPGPAARVIPAARATQQIAAPSKLFPQPLSVIVTDAEGNPLSGVRVGYTSTTASAVLDATEAWTDAFGAAQVSARAGELLGSAVVTAAVEGGSGSLVRATFTLVSDGSAGRRIVLLDGLGAADEAATATDVALETATETAVDVDDVDDSAGAGLACRALSLCPRPFTFQVQEADGSPVAGAAVAFEGPSDALVLTALSSTTDARGRIALRVAARSRPGRFEFTARAAGITTPVTAAVVVESIPVRLDWQQAPPLVDLGDVASLSVRVVAPSGAPAGAVRFVSGESLLAEVALDAASTATAPITWSQEGAYAVRALYAGAGAFAGESSEPRTIEVRALSLAGGGCQSVPAGVLAALLGTMWLHRRRRR